MATDQKTIDELRARARADVAGLPPMDVPAVAKKPPVAHCNSCHAPIWWRLNPSGKRQPMDYDLVTAMPTDMPHHATCKDRDKWRRK